MKYAMTRKKRIVGALILVCILAALVGTFFFYSDGIPFGGTVAEEKKRPPLIPEALQWEEVASTTPWGPRDSHATAVFKDKIWLIGGLDATRTMPTPGKVKYDEADYFNDVWSFDENTKWVRVLEDGPWSPRRSQQLVSFKGSLWLIGGWGPSGYAQTVWTSIDGINWTEIEPQGGLPEIEGHEVIVFRDRLWLTGGVHYDTRTLLDEVWSSPDGIHWEKSVADAPWFPRWDHAFTEFKGAMWIFGGMDLAANEFNDVWRSEDGISWKRVLLHAPWRPRQGHTALAYEDRLWLIGRLDDQFARGENDVWFSSDGSGWNKTNENPSWRGREDHTALVYNDRIWLVGGMDSHWKWVGDVWRTILSE